jgi:hypothetical protein
MRDRLLTLLVAIVGLAAPFPTSRAATVLTDDFDDGIFDTAKWNSVLPLPSSSLNESGGSLNLSNRPLISTVSQFDFPITVSGSFTASRYDIIRILTRSDLQVEEPYYQELQGLRFSFFYDSNTIQISDSNHNTVAQKPYQFETNQSYDFVTTDDGTNVSWFINGVNQLSGTSSYNSTANHVAFYNRESDRGWAIHSATSFDFFSISSVPEPSQTLSPLVLFFSLIVSRRRPI